MYMYVYIYIYIYIFIDDYKLTTFAQSIRNSIPSLQSENNIAIVRFISNKMIDNSGKSESILTDKKKRDHPKETFEMGDKVTEASPSVKF